MSNQARKTVRVKVSKGGRLSAHKRTVRKKGEAFEKQMQALELRKSGATYEMIARTLGYANAGGAHKSVRAALDSVVVEASKAVVDLDLQRLDEYQMRCTHALRTNGDLSQIDRLLRVMEMRYRLMGINDETVRSIQSEHGITRTINNQVMVIQATEETQEEFVKKMMTAVGVNPESKEARRYLKSTPLPPIPITNKGIESKKEKTMKDEDIVDAEIVDEM